MLPLLSESEAAGFTGAKEVFASEDGKALLKKWGVEGDYEGIGHCVLGYPAADGSEGEASERELCVLCRLNE